MRKFCKTAVCLLLASLLTLFGFSLAFAEEASQTSIPQNIDAAKEDLSNTNHNLSNASGSTDAKPDATTRDELLIPLNNDFRSRTETVYHNINGNDVTVYGLYRHCFEQGNNPNFAQALMISQCIKYKEQFPEENVYITIQSFHFSIALAACVDPQNPNYGHTKNIYDCDYTEDGYYRLSYLLVEAAKKGIEVTVIGQLDADGTDQGEGKVNDISFVGYFDSHLSDDAYISGKKVSDYMDFVFCRWMSYGDKSAADMMHNKTCTVSNYIDNNGEKHGAAIWTGSINIDGVNHLEQNGNEAVQTAVVITEHEEMRRVMYNYAKLVAAYRGQEDIVPFRAEVAARTTAQIELLRNGRGNEIPKDEQIVYLGTENDRVFELYFTPFGGSFSTWDTVHNPYVKYIAELLDAATGEDYIEFVWNNVKYTQNFELADMMMEAVNHAFVLNNNKDSLLHLHMAGVKTEFFDKLVAGENIGYKYVNTNPGIHHTKDLQLSYVKNGERQFVTILNSLNIHEGSMYHQTNTVLVIKESESVGSHFYASYAMLTTPSFDFLSRRTAAR